MFKLLKIAALLGVGMMFSPKKGTALRADLVDFAKKYRPQLQKFIATLDEVWEKSQSEESDEVVANIEYKLNELKTATTELDSVETKELAYKILNKIGETSVKIGKEIVQSKNFKVIAQDLAIMTVQVIDKTSEVYSNVKDVSDSMAPAIVVDSDQVNKEKIELELKKEKIKKVKEA